MNRRNFLLGAAGAAGATVIKIKPAISDSTAFQEHIAVRAAVWRQMRSAVPRTPIDYTVESPETQIAPGEHKALEMRPQCLFRSDRIETHCTDGHEGLWVMKVFIGKKLQRADGYGFDEPMPMSAFTSPGIEWRLDTLEKALTLLVCVQNNSSTTKRVSFKAHGKAVL